MGIRFLKSIQMMVLIASAVAVIAAVGCSKSNRSKGDTDGIAPASAAPAAARGAPGYSPQPSTAAASSQNAPESKKSLDSAVTSPSPSPAAIEQKTICGNPQVARTVPAQLELQFPLDIQLLQREPDSSGSLSFEAKLVAPVSCLEVKIDRLAGGKSAEGDWEILKEFERTSTSLINGHIKLPNSGWYFVSIRAWSGDMLGPVVRFPNIGVGEVFLTSGQSNSANHGGTPQVQKTGQVFMWGPNGWVHARDPLPGATAFGGAPWIPMADELVQKLNMPIGIVATGYGGTAVAQWLPTASPSLYPRIQTPLVQLKRTGVRAVLWHQGETDAAINTTTEAYQQGLSAVIRATQLDFGQPLKWFVARATVCQSAEDVEVRAAQTAIVDGSLVFSGPDTDKFLGPALRLVDGCHFSSAGLSTHGRAWADAVLKVIQP